MMKRFGLLTVLVAAGWLSGCANAPGDFRHVVLFKFKDGVTPEKLETVGKQIMDMQGKIPTVKAMERGTDCSVEGLQDEFTHCFLVTFEDAEGLAVYSPHAAHQDVIKSVKPIREKVLVFDYIAKEAIPPMAPIETKGKLRHVVMFQFKEDATPEQVKAIEDKFRSLPARISEIKAFECGTIVGKGGASAGFTHCFLVTFDNADGRKVYLPHPAHKEFVELVKPSLKKVLVVDYIAAD